MKDKVAIIGANDFQNPLILKAKEKGYETHVFAWKEGAVGEKNADFFYPISIVEKDAILKQCRELGITGVCSIGSDLASLTVNYVANQLGLTANSDESALLST
ncbi:MAG: carbamoyl-phosphate synthase large subunit, partial [Eubacterium sp.]